MPIIANDSHFVANNSNTTLIAMSSDLMTGLGLLIIVGIFLWCYRHDKKVMAKRLEVFGRFAKEKGWRYQDKCNFESLGIPSQAWFCAQGTPTSVQNLLEWSAQGFRVWAFRYNFINNLTQKTSFEKSLICLFNPKMSLPWFRGAMKKDWRMSYPRPKKEWEDIHPDSSDPFFSRFIIRSKQKKETMQLIPESLGASCSWMEWCMVEGLGSFFFINPPQLTMPEENLEQMATNAASFLNNFLSYRVSR